MACEYYSRVEIETFASEKHLKAALERMKAQGYRYQVNGLTVQANDRAALGLLKQAYQTEATKATLKARGMMVGEKLDAKTGKIKLTVQA